MDYESVKYVEGFIDNIIYRNEDNGYTVFEIIYQGEDVTCVGTLSYINTGEFITANGEFVKHAVYYMQFKISSYEFKAPADKESVRRYLSSGAVKGIGSKMAERIVDTFGDDTFRIMEDEPERLAEIKGISIAKAMDIANQLADKHDMRRAMMFLQNYGIQMNLANKIFKRYGNDIYTIIEQNPYRLADDIEGVGFKTADEIASRVGIKVDSEFRIRSGMFYCLNQAALQGHVYLPYEELKRQVSSLLLIDIGDYDKFLMDLAIDKKIVVRTEGESKNVYSAMYFYMEQNVARALAGLDIKCDENINEVNNRIAGIERSEGIVLDDIQKEAVVKAALNGLVIITGGPGTGKTTTINTIIKYFEMEGLEIRLAAPTGRAAKRMTEATGYEAQTIHRLLEVNVNPEEAENSGGFLRNRQNPLEADVIIIDEMSMVDLTLMHALLSAVIPGTRLILVGDVDQLPSVGPGSVLKDIIASHRFPVVTLTRIFRQAGESDIIVNAHKINAGEPVIPDNKSRDFFFLRRQDADTIIGIVIMLIQKKLPKYVGADQNEIQVMTPTRKGLLGVERLNEILQKYLNPEEPKKAQREINGRLFREGDKVMQIKNNYQIEWEVSTKFGLTVDKGTGVFNGDMGVITEINEYTETIEVEFDESRKVKYGFDMTEELELAYAITVHKSQGSEYPAVIIPLLPGPKLLYNRNLLYTAVTRAKKCLTIVGSEAVFQEMIQNKNEQARYTSLAERIQEF